MKESATCALCGHGYAHPDDLDAKTGMHCASCGALIYVNGASLRGSPHFRFPVGAGTPGKKDGSAASRQKKKRSARFRPKPGHAKAC